jgi:hypothetical protein
MPYYAPLAKNSKEICSICGQPAIHVWETLTKRTIPLCEPCYKDLQAVEDKNNDIAPFSGSNEYGEYYDEDSY